jgi:hypothetical protein
MLRLTLRSGKDGRFLACIVDRGGFPFVLDFGDPRIIDDAQQRLLHGFTMWRFGQLVNVPPPDPNMVVLLADFYVGEGLLVAVEEPTWSGREAPVAAPPAPLFPIEALPAELPERDDTTELRDAPDDLTDLGPLLEPEDPVDAGGDDGLEDDQTEIVD